MKKKAVTYLRVSCGEQSLENQLPEIKRLVRARKLKLVATFEESVSAAARSRSQFDEMMVGAPRGDFEVVVVWSLDDGQSASGA